MTEPTYSLPERLKQWWKFFTESGRKHGMDALLLAAICDRESRGGMALTPPGPSGTGDHGFGLGLMQIDRRFHGEFAQRRTSNGVPLWSLPEWNISYAAGILADDLHAFRGNEVQAIGAYNAGRARVARACGRLQPPISDAALLAIVDSLTTGGNYVSYVLARRRSFSHPETLQ